MQAHRKPDPLRKPMEAGESERGRSLSPGVVMPLSELLSRLNHPTEETHTLSFSRGYGILPPDEYTRVEGQFMALFDVHKKGLGSFFQNARGLARELFRNAFKHGTKNPFGGSVKFHELESGTHYAFGILDEGAGFPEYVIQTLADNSPPSAFSYRGDGLHGNCFMKLKRHIRDGLIEAVAFPEDRRGIYVLLRKTVGQ